MFEKLLDPTVLPVVLNGVLSALEAHPGGSLILFAFTVLVVVGIFAWKRK